MSEAVLEEAKSIALPRETPLTIEGISDIRSDVVFGSLKGKKYQIDDAEVSVVRKPIDPDEFQDETHGEEVRALIQNKENGEVYPYERLVVNALIEQLHIAEKFGLPKEGLLLHLKSDYLSRGTITLDN